MPEPTSLAAELRALTNRNTVEAVRKGFAAIDHHSDRAKAELKKIGVNGDELVDKGTDFLKRKAIELLTGRPQA